MDDIERQLKELGDRAAQEVTYQAVPRTRIARRARLRRGLTLGVPVAAVVLVAVIAYPRLDSIGDRGSTEDRGVPVAIDLGAAAEATERAGTARTELRMTGDFGGVTYSFDLVGEVDFEGLRSYSRGTQEGPMALPPEFEMITIGDVLYQRAAGDPKWVRTKLDVPGGSTPFGPAADEYFSYLESVTDEVTSLGEEVLDGERVTHLRATIEESEIPMMTAQVRFEPLHVWIDEANRVRKMTFSMSYEGSDPSTAGTTTMTSRFWDFGIPVDIAAPPPEDVTKKEPSSFDFSEDQELQPPPDSSQDGEETLNEFGTTDPVFIYGDGGYDEPNILMAGTGHRLAGEGHGDYFVCLHDLPLRWTTAEIVEESSGRTIVAVAGEERSRVGKTKTSAACVPGGLAEEEAEALTEDPSGYTLRLERKGPDVVVPLTTSWQN